MQETYGPYESESIQRSRAHAANWQWPLLVLIGMILFIGTIIWAVRLFATDTDETRAPSSPSVLVSQPLPRDIVEQMQFLGHFSAVHRVELRSQVGGTLVHIAFRDGQVVNKGDLLFLIDAEPYEIKMSHAIAQLESAKVRFQLAVLQLERAEMLKRTDAGSTENVDLKMSEKRTAQAAVADAEAMIRDARFDLDHCRITAPFTGRIGRHLVSVGNLVSGSRGGNNPTTLLATLVSVHPIYFDFDMSETEYMAIIREHQIAKTTLPHNVNLSLDNEANFNREATLDFIDNTLDRSSGTIHARATVPNKDAHLTPGGFARVRVAVSRPSPALLVPDAAVLADQAEHLVLTVTSENIVSPKLVKIGGIEGGLRVIRSGLDPSDNVIIDGIPTARIGAHVSPSKGSIQLDSDAR